MREKRDQNALMITHQYRIPRNRGMTYGLKCDGVYLTLVVSPRLNGEDPGDWRVEARAKQQLRDDVIEAQWGETRREALSAMGRSWNEHARMRGLRMFDWEDVARVLNEVRAL